MGEKINVEGQDFYIEVMKEDKEVLLLAFRKIKDSYPFTPEDIKEIKEDTKDWGKWRVFNKLKKDLEK